MCNRVIELFNNILLVYFLIRYSMYVRSQYSKPPNSNNYTILIRSHRLSFQRGISLFKTFRLMNKLIMLTSILSPLDR